MPQVDVEELRWTEVSLGEVAMPKETLRLAAGFGSGLTSAPGRPGTTVWAICDRGPNLKLKDARKLYGWTAPHDWRDVDGAKLMPRPDIGPALALLEVGETAVELKRTVRVRDADGRPVSGLPIPDSGHAECEPVLDLDGRHVTPDPAGMDTEGLALLADGSFWAAEEYGPSLLRLGAGGEVLERLVPQGVALAGAPYPVRDSLPALAARRHLNRGFEAIAVAPSGRHLYVAFQSPLAHPGKAQHERGRHVRLWRLDPGGAVTAQYLYPLDPPGSFARDCAKKDMDRSDIKLCEIAALDDDRLLMLERGSETSKIYRVSLDPSRELGPEHLDIDTRPTLEELSASDEPLPALAKALLFTSDDWPVVGADIEGMTPIAADQLLIVSDNDFGCEGKQTRFYRLSFDVPLASSWKDGSILGLPHGHGT